MDNEKYLKILTEDIHSVVISTLSDKGLPVTRVIDIMLYDENGIYFLTAKGKSFFTQLVDQQFVSLTGITTDKNTMNKKSITISGTVKNIGKERLEEIFNKNSYMSEIYESLESRSALEVFQIYKFQGEYFDLSTKPIKRVHFTHGNYKLNTKSYHITHSCVCCGDCIASCPSDCIVLGEPYQIITENCLQCGNCFDVCKYGAVIRKGS